MTLLSAVFLVLIHGVGLSIPAQMVATITAFVGLIVSAILDHLTYRTALLTQVRSRESQSGQGPSHD